MNQAEQQYELRRLELVLQQIKLKINQGLKNCNDSGSDLQEALTSFWERPRVDFRDQAQLTELIDRQRSLADVSKRRQFQFVKMASSPYFGRIDFLEEGLAKPEMIYIGIANLADTDSGENWIYDWRSPVAGMFYDYERGYSQYQCPAGIICGEITLKRQYKIKDGRMVYMFDADLKIDDEILQELLSQSVDEKMHTIVNTIQREQNRVIRDQKHQVLAVQGAAGSGKTSIALHRAAYLLYRERDRITAKNILIFSPNRIFSDYISNVLPELGEENILQTTFAEYIHNGKLKLPLIEFEDGVSQLEYLFSGFNDPWYRIRTAGVSYKSSPVFAEVIWKYLAFINERLIREYPVIEYRGRIIFSKAEWEELFFKNLAYLPLAERLLQIKRRIRIKLRPLIYELRREKEQKIAASGEEVNEHTIKALARLAAWRELRSLVTKVVELTTIEPLLLYRRLFEDRKLFADLTAGTETPVDWELICEQSLAWLDKGKISYEDSLPFFYFLGTLTGFPLKTGIRHVIVDEAQDYTILQFEILRRLLPGCSWTLLGDPDQMINPYQQEADFEKVVGIMNDWSAESEKNSSVIRLTRSYRSTEEIQAFSRALLSKTPVENIRRSGPLPQLVRVKSAEWTPKLIADAIHKLKDEGRQSIAVITKTAQESYTAHEALKDKTEITHVTWEMEEFQRGTVLIPSYLAKGLEFDAVIIYDTGNKTYGREGERNLLYIACTRALHSLLLYYSGELSPFIAGIGENLYHSIFVEC